MRSSAPYHISSPFTLLPGETLHDLEYNNMKIIQRAGAFHFGTDAVLLSDFLLLRKGDRALDLGTGTGAIPLLVCAHREGVCMDAVEIQPDMADMAARSVSYNALSERIRVYHMDMRDAPEYLGRGAYDLVACNPPYSRAGAALLSASENKRVSRHEGDISLPEICLCAGALIKNGGRFAVVYPAQRMFEMMTAMRAARLEPKRVRCVQHTLSRAPKLALIDAVKNGGEQLHWLPPLILRNEDGTPAPEWTRIYGK